MSLACNYGVVGLVVKMDDLGLRIFRGGFSLARGMGCGLVWTMPVLMQAFSIIGRCWGGGIEEFGLTGLPHIIRHEADEAAAKVPFVGLVVDWTFNALGAAIVGLIVGGLITALMLSVQRRQSKVAG